MEVAAGGPSRGLEIPCCPFDEIEECRRTGRM